MTDGEHLAFGERYWRSTPAAAHELAPLAASTIDEATFRLLADSIPTLCWVANGDGYIVWYNQRWHEYCGSTAESMEGWGWTAVHDPDRLPEVIENWTAAIVSGRPFEMTFPLRGADGVFRPFLTRVQPVRDAAGQVGRWFGVNMDVSNQLTAERALDAERDLSRQVLEGMAEGFGLMDPDFRILALNAEAMRLESRSRGDIIGKTHWEAYPGSEDSEVGRLYKRAMAERVPLSLEHHYAWEDGHSTWLDMRAYPVAAGLAVFYRDVSDRKRTEAERDRAGELLGTFLQAVPGVVYAKDRDGRMLVANRGTAELIGKSPADFIGRTDAEFLEDKAQAAIIMETDRRILGSGRVETLEEAISLPDGRPAIWLSTKAPLLDAGGAIVGLIGSSVDVTAQIKAREILARSREDLEREVAERTAERDRVWRHSRDLIVVVGTDGIFRSVNPAWTAILGHQPVEVVGRSVSELIWPDDAALTQSALADASETDLTAFENRFTHKDGSARWISWHTSVAGDLVYAYGRDVTAEKENAAALQQAEAALRQAQKMEAVGQLTGGLAHDFNNLLTAITGSLDLLQMRMRQGRLENVARYVNAAQSAAKRAAALTHRLLAFSRRQTLDPKPTDVNRLASDMADLIRQTVGPEITVEVVGTVGLWTALVDSNQLENALLNLSINARDAMPDGGRLTIETGNRWMDERAARERDVPPGQYLSVCVSDTGTGMSADVIARAFDPFFTTKPLGQGTGLGLSMVYGFTRQSGGQVRIYSEVGSGTVVCMYLPRLYGGEAQQEDDRRVGELPRAEQGETVLVVDDEPTIRMLVSEVLLDLGYLAIEAGDGAAGLKVLESSTRIDLLVTDVGLPGGMNGRQVADAARLLRPGLKVLFITGYAENAAVGNGHLDPGMQVLTKPFNMEDLASRISGLIER
jgi:PAS domain S-box-containing protein